MALSFALEQKSKIISGAGSISKVGEMIKDAGYTKAFAVYDPGIEKAGIAKRVCGIIRDAGVDVVEYGKAQPDPPDVIVEEAADLCKTKKCDCVVGIGGGSTIDTAKGVTVLRFNRGRILDYANPENQMCHCPGLISVPTTAGTGSELSNGIIISDSDTGRKIPLVGYNAMSEYVVLDPELTVGMPRGLTIMTGLDVFSHALEAYTTILSTPIIAPICEKVMQNVVEYLPRAVANGNDIEAREVMLMSASLGGWMLANACAHVGHSMAHVIGGAFHMPHGAACAYTLPSAIKFVTPAVPDKIMKAGQILGAVFDNAEEPDEIADLTCKAYRHFRDNILGMKPLASWEIDQDAAMRLAGEVVNETFAMFTPRQVTLEDARAMLWDTFRPIDFR